MSVFIIYENKKKCRLLIFKSSRLKVNISYGFYDLIHSLKLKCLQFRSHVRELQSKALPYDSDLRITDLVIAAEYLNMSRECEKTMIYNK